MQRNSFDHFKTQSENKLQNSLGLQDSAKWH